MDGVIISLAREWGPAGVSAIFMLLLYFGFFESRRAVNRLERVMTQQVEDAREREIQWRSVAETQRETIQLQAEKLAEAVEQGRMTVALLESIAREARVPGNGRHYRGG